MRTVRSSHRAVLFPYPLVIPPEGLKEKNRKELAVRQSSSPSIGLCWSRLVQRQKKTKTMPGCRGLQRAESQANPRVPDRKECVSRRYCHARSSADGVGCRMERNLGQIHGINLKPGHAILSIAEWKSSPLGRPVFKQLNAQFCW
jgi:hypothetical protein